MKVFKFTVDDFYYAYSGKDEQEARDVLFEETGITDVNKVEEIPESQWDIKMIHIWEDDDVSKEPFKVSIRSQLIEDQPSLIFTNDYGI